MGDSSSSGDTDVVSLGGGSGEPEASDSVDRNSDSSGLVRAARKVVAYTLGSPSVRPGNHKGRPGDPSEGHVSNVVRRVAVQVKTELTGRTSKEWHKLDGKHAVPSVLLTKTRVHATRNGKPSFLTASLDIFDHGTLADYQATGDGLVTSYLVAFSPSQRVWYKAEEVELAKG